MYSSTCSARQLTHTARAHTHTHQQLALADYIIALIVPVALFAVRARTQNVIVSRQSRVQWELIYIRVYYTIHTLNFYISVSVCLINCRSKHHTRQKYPFRYWGGFYSPPPPPLRDDNTHYVSSCDNELAFLAWSESAFRSNKYSPTRKT